MPVPGIRSTSPDPTNLRIMQKSKIKTSSYIHVPQTNLIFIFLTHAQTHPWLCPRHESKMDVSSSRGHILCIYIREFFFFFFHILHLLNRAGAHRPPPRHQTKAKLEVERKEEGTHAINTRWSYRIVSYACVGDTIYKCERGERTDLQRSKELQKKKTTCSGILDVGVYNCMGGMAVVMPLRFMYVH